MSDISYAVLTRAKAKYGKRLREKDYKSLLACTSVAEVMTYLKSNTHYIKAFGEANERGIRRGLFENLLKQYITNQMDLLSSYELSVGASFSKFIAQKNEIEEIVRFLTLLNNQEDKYEAKFSFTVPRHMAKNTSIDLNTLSEAKTYTDFLEAVKGTRYEKLLASYNIKDGDAIPITEIENKLYLMLYDGLNEAILTTDQSERFELRDMFNVVVDYENFVRIVRLKKYYKTDASVIRSLLIPYGSLSEKTINMMVNAENSEEVYGIMLRTKNGKMINKINYTHTGELPLRTRFRKANHNMYFSDSPATVIFSYYLLCEIELHNLVCIIEGARYNVSRDKIEPLLIY